MKNNKLMENYEYEKMFLFEEDYWWYKGLRLLIKEYLRNIKGNKKKIKVLDAGCGTGGNLRLLKQLGYKKISAFDLSEKAVSFCHKRGFKEVIKANINKIPFKKNSFDLIICIDVFENTHVKEQVAYRELIRVLKPNGYLLITVPSFQFLLNEHDRAVHNSRRYTKKRIVNSFFNKKVKVLKLNYYLFFSFPFILFFKLFKKFIKKDDQKPQSDLVKLPFWVNELFYFTFFLEAKLSRLISFPFGNSLFLLVKKRINNDG